MTVSYPSRFYADSLSKFAAKVKEMSVYSRHIMDIFLHYSYCYFWSFKYSKQSYTFLYVSGFLIKDFPFPWESIFISASCNIHSRAKNISSNTLFCCFTSCCPEGDAVLKTKGIKSVSQAVDTAAVL